MVTTRTEASIQKRFGLISAECSKFTGSFEHAVARPQSGIGIGDLAFQALKVYKAEHGGKSFNFAHCYRKLKDNQKWKDLHNASRKIRAMEAATRAMEAENKKKEVELALAAQEAQIMAMDLSRFTPRKKAYYEKKRERYMEARVIDMASTVAGMA
ncbi:hypothetical protein ZWY2020_000140 [Hordeum vulgare]|nr:hypothetical protein ZWY2020_000140 [Hordeum vulgare]